MRAQRPVMEVPFWKSFEQGAERVLWSQMGTGVGDGDGDGAALVRTSQSS